MLEARLASNRISPPSRFWLRGANTYPRAYVFVCMRQTSIRLSEEAKARLDEYKRRGESYEDVIRRLTTKDNWAGFGAFSVDEEGMEEIRQELREDMDEDVDDLDA